MDMVHNMYKRRAGKPHLFGSWLVCVYRNRSSSSFKTLPHGHSTSRLMRELRGCRRRTNCNVAKGLVVSAPLGWNHGDGLCTDYSINAATSADRSPPSSSAPALFALSNICFLITWSGRGERGKLLLLHMALRSLISKNDALPGLPSRITNKTRWRR